MTDINNTPPLDLTDEATVAQLVANDVLKRPVDEEELAVADKLRKLQQKVTFSFKLNGNELEDVQRKAASKNMDWKTYLEHEIKTLVFNQPVGRPTVDTPSFVVGGRVGGPVGGLVTRG